MPPLPRIIAICGYKRSGKDTLANYIVEHYQYKPVKIAEQLKDVVRTLFGFTEEQVEADVKDALDERWGITPRKAMQFIGTEVFQYKIQELLPGIGRNFWIQSLIKKHLADGQTRIVVSDLRFMHEYRALKEQGAFIIRLTRKRAETDDGNVATDTHSSETEYLQIPADMELQNDRGIEHLYRDFDGRMEAYQLWGVDWFKDKVQKNNR